ncbi:hypothetical protein, partial [Thiolapillus sp.]
KSNAHSRNAIRRRLNTLMQVEAPLRAYGETVSMFGDDGRPTPEVMEILKAHKAAVEKTAEKLGSAPSEISGYLNGPVMRHILDQLAGGMKPSDLDPETTANSVAGLVTALPERPDQFFMPIQEPLQAQLQEAGHQMELRVELGRAMRPFGNMMETVLNGRSSHEVADSLFEMCVQKADADATVLCNNHDTPDDAPDRSIARASLLKTYAHTVAVGAMWDRIDELKARLTQIRKSQDREVYQALLKELKEASPDWVSQESWKGCEKVIGQLILKVDAAPPKGGLDSNNPKPR